MGWRVMSSNIEKQETIMYHFIITAIVALAAAKVKAQAKDNLTSSRRREKSEAKRGVAN